MRRAAALAIAAALLVPIAAYTASTIINTGRLTIVIPAGSILAKDEKGLHKLPRGSVVVVNVYMPYPGGLLRAAGTAEAPGTLRLQVPVDKALSAWLGSGLPGRGRYPLLTVLVTAYTPQGEYIGGAALDPSDALTLLHGLEPWKAQQLLEKDPSKAIARAYHGTLVLRSLVLHRIDIGGVIDKAVRDTEKIAHVKHRGITEHGVLPDGTQYTGIVYNDLLYSLRDKPPKAWYQRVLIGGRPAPKQLVDQLWYAYATHFSRIYYIPATRSLEDVLAFAYVTAWPGTSHAGSKYYMIRSMTEFLRDLEVYKLGQPPNVEWKDITPSLPPRQVTAPLICAYMVFNDKTSDELSALTYLLTETGKIKEGTSIFGLITIGEAFKAEVKPVVKASVDANRKYPVACIYAKGSVVSGYAPGFEQDVALTLVDVRREGNYWVVKPAVVFMPTLSLWLDYKHPITEQYSTYVDPVGSNDFLWHIALNRTATLIYTGMPKDNNVFVSDISVVDNASLSVFSGTLLDYYFPHLAKFLHAVGLVNTAVSTIAQLIAGASSGGYGALALEFVELISDIVHITVAQAYDTQLELIFNGHVEDHPAYTVVEKETAIIPPSVSGFKPILCMYWVTVGKYEAPPHPLIRGRG